MSLILDLHVHSIYSRDAILSPEKIVKIAKIKGLSGVAVTDHETIRGAIKAKSVVFDDFIVITGTELKTDKGEVIGLFIEEEIKSREFTEVTDEIRDQNGVIMLPHPYRNRLEDPKNLLKAVDLIEGLNARIPKELNRKAQYLAIDHGLPIVAGSDAHTPFEIGRARTIVPVSEASNIKDCLLSGEVMIEGRESSYPFRMFSVAIGKYKRDGVLGLLKTFSNKMMKK